ncbi:MAG TPA: polymer-forming cytoskeletal protein [Anaerolineales bacterium]|nr:polymer-forming cytoskeletal protein [Anaerolineales bacterium]
MRLILKLALGLLLLIALAWPQTARAEGLLDDEVVFGGTFRLESGETLDGNLIILGGIATLEEGSILTGNVVLLGGTVQAAGVIQSNVVGLGGLVSLADTAVVEGNVTSIGAHVDQAEGAQVEGDITDAVRGPLTFTFPGGVEVPRIDFGFTPVFDLMWFVLKVFLWAALAVLAVLFLPAHTKRVSEAAVGQPLVAGGLGLLSVVVLPLAAIILAITIIMIPAVLILVLLVGLAWAFGLIALGLEVGNRIEKLLNQEWVAAVSAGVGTFVLMLVLNGLDVVIPCVGWVIPALAGFVGLGAVLLTRFGTQNYPVIEPAPASVNSLQESAQSSVEEQ